MFDARGSILIKRSIFPILFFFISTNNIYLHPQLDNDESLTGDQYSAGSARFDLRQTNDDKPHPRYTRARRFSFNFRLKSPASIISFLPSLPPNYMQG